MDLGGIPYIRLARRRYIRAETLEAMKAPRFIERIFAEITNALGTNI